MKKYYKFSELSEEAKTNAVVMYMQEFNEDREEDDKINYQDSYSCLSIDLEDEDLYTALGDFVSQD